MAQKDEIPRATTEALERIAGACITTGFIQKACADDGYSSYMEANVHADRIWAVFEALADSLLPTIAAPLIGWKDADPTLGPYTEKSAALAVFRPHMESLQHDCFIEFGLIFQSSGCTEEIFVTASKHMQIWTNRHENAESTLLSMGVPRAGNLQFIDEFPRVTERLPNGPSADETISTVLSSFQYLPRR